MREIVPEHLIRMSSLRPVVKEPNPIENDVSLVIRGQPASLLE